MIIALWISLPVLLRQYSVINLDEADQKIMRLRKFGVLYAIYISFAVSTNIHWLSDVIMGIFVGITSGLATSKIFLNNWQETDMDEQSSQRVRYFWLLIFFIIFFTFWGIDDFL